MIHTFNKTDFDARKAAKTQAHNAPPANTLPALRDLVEAIAKALGIK